MMKKRTAWIVPIGLMTLAVLSLVAIGCSGGGGGGNDDGDFDGIDGPSSRLNSGIFTDSPVAGLQYRTDTQSGVTDEAGTFHYMDGETIDFHLGDVDLGSAPAEPVMTPLHLVSGAEDETHPHVTNMVRFLQTLDADGEPANGIHIPADMHSFMEGRVIDFRMGETAFETDQDVERFMDDLMRHDGYGHVGGMVDINDAQGHMRGTLIGQMAGFYTAEYDGDDAGVMEIEVHEDGTFQGTATSHMDGQTHAVSGVVESDGDLHFNDGGNLDFTGEIHRGMGPGSSRTLEVSAMHDDGTGAPGDGSDMPDQGGDDGDHPGGDPDDMPGPMVREGVFVDSPVAGVAYRTPTQSGVTDDNGVFHYLEGERVSFHMGDIMLGEADAQPVMTPLHLVPGAEDASHPAVTNMLRFLQTLDEDMNPENGIQIMTSVMDQMHGYDIDFHMDPVDFQQHPDVQEMLELMGDMSGHGFRGLVSPEDARDHFMGEMMDHYGWEGPGDEGGGDHFPGMGMP